MSVLCKHHFPELLLKFSYGNAHSYTNKNNTSPITDTSTEHELSG